MSVEHRCDQMPKGVKSMVLLEDGWHINFANSFWVVPVKFCPWCGRKFSDGNDAFFVANRGSSGVRAVRCIDTGETFPSIARAAKAHNVSDMSIIRVCKGQAKQAKGERWEFVER